MATYRQLYASVYHVFGFVGATEMLDDADLTIFYNNASALIEAKHSWYFNTRTENIVPGVQPGSAFTLPYEVYQTYEVRGFEDVNDTEGTVLKKVQKTPSEDCHIRFDFNTAATFKDWHTIDVFATWGMTRRTGVSTDVIVLPQLIQAALYNYMLFYAVPLYVDTGFELARFYFEAGNRNLDAAVAAFSTMKGPESINLTR